MPQIERQSPKHETVMDVTKEQIARVYAKAFLGAAANAANTVELVEEVYSVADDVLARFPQLDAALRSALVAEEQKERVLERVFGGRASPMVLSFLKVLAQHGRLELLRPIGRQLKELYSEHLGRTDVEVCVASALDGGLQQEIYEQLRATLGAEPVLHVTVDPSLIAGIMIRVGDRVYDGSVATQLNLARRAMIDRATEQIESRPEKFLLPTA